MSPVPPPPPAENAGREPFRSPASPLEFVKLPPTDFSAGR